MIKLKKTRSGYVIPVLVAPGSSQNAIRGQHDGHMKVAVSAAPEGGKANEAVIELLSSELDIKQSQVHIMSGERSSKKEILVERVSASALDDIVSGT